MIITIITIVIMISVRYEDMGRLAGQTPRCRYRLGWIGKNWSAPIRPKNLTSFKPLFGTDQNVKILHLVLFHNNQNTWIFHQNSLGFPETSFKFGINLPKWKNLFGVMIQNVLKGPQRTWFLKHRKNCECCHHHSVFRGHNVIVHIVVLNCQNL